MQWLACLGMPLGHLSAEIKALLGVTLALRGGVEGLLLVGRVPAVVGVSEDAALDRVCLREEALALLEARGCDVLADAVVHNCTATCT